MPQFNVSMTNMKLTPSNSTRRYSQTARAEAAEATGQRIIEAFLARLQGQWFDEITLDRVAADAGVTVQTVVRRFGGKEGLLAASLKVMGERIMMTRAAPVGDVERIVANLLVDYEQTGETVLRLLALEPRHPSLKQFLDIGRRSHREWVMRAFEDVLRDLSGAARERGVDLLVIATDVYTWKLLRLDMGRGQSETKHAIKTLIEGVLAEI